MATQTTRLVCKAWACPSPSRFLFSRALPLKAICVYTPWRKAENLPILEKGTQYSELCAQKAETGAHFRIDADPANGDQDLLTLGYCLHYFHLLLQGMKRPRFPIPPATSVSLGKLKFSFTLLWRSTICCLSLSILWKKHQADEEWEFSQCVVGREEEGKSSFYDLNKSLLFVAGIIHETHSQALLHALQKKRTLPLLTGVLEYPIFRREGREWPGNLTGKLFYIDVPSRSSPLFLPAYSDWILTACWTTFWPQMNFSCEKPSTKSKTNFSQANRYGKDPQTAFNSVVRLEELCSF